MKAAGRRTQEQRRVATLEALLQAAVIVLARKGFVATSLQDVADAAGVSKGAVFYHFKSKDELVQQVLTRCGVVLRQAAQTAWEGPGTPAERVRATLRALWLARRTQRPEMAVMADMIALGVHDERVRAAVARFLSEERWTAWPCTPSFRNR